MMDIDNSTVALLITAIAVAASAGFFVGMFKKRSEPHVTDLLVYPIKSCAPLLPKIKLAVVTELGFRYDRMAQVSKADDGNYCTPRDPKCAKLFHIKPQIKNDGNTLVLSAPGVSEDLTIDLKNKSSKVVEATPIIGPKVKLDDYGDEVATWLEKATSIEGCRLTAIGTDYKRIVEVNPDQGDAIPSAPETPVSLADEAPFLLTSTSSLQDLNKRMKARGKDPVPMERFRPNIVIRGLKPWQEDTLKRIRISGVEFHVWQRCGRCAMTTIDRQTLKRGPEPLATLSEFRERARGMRNFGMHMIPVASTVGKEDTVIGVGDTMEILEYDEERKKEWEELFG